MKSKIFIIVSIITIILSPLLTLKATGGVIDWNDYETIEKEITYNPSYPNQETLVRLYKELGRAYVMQADVSLFNDVLGFYQDIDITASTTGTQISVSFNNNTDGFMIYYSESSALFIYDGSFFSDFTMYFTYFIHKDFINEFEQKGYNDGIDVGYYEGKQEGYNQGYEVGQLKGEQIAREYYGYNLDGFGWITAIEWGDTKYNYGLADGLADGYDNGYEDGINEEYENILEIGYNEGKEEYGFYYMNEWITATEWGDIYNENLTKGPGGFKNMIVNVFTGIGSILSISLMPGITIGTIVLVPLVFGLLAFILGRRD